MYPMLTIIHKPELAWVGSDQGPMVVELTACTGLFDVAQILIETQVIFLDAPVERSSAHDRAATATSIPTS